MSLQENILKKFLEAYENPTFKEISRLTGINQTRIFRLMNGSAMRLSEYQIFRDLVQSKTGRACVLEDAARNCQQVLGLDDLLEILDLMERKIKVKKLKEGGVL